MNYIVKKIKTIKNKPKHYFYTNDDMVDIMNDTVKKELQGLHDNYVIVNADKASNNIIITCKKYYLKCMKEELGLNDIDNKGNKTYKFIKDKSINDIIDIHNEYMNKHDIDLHYK